MLARELASLTGESTDGAVCRALEERLAQLKSIPTQPTLAASIRQIQESVAALPVLDPRAGDELLGYDAGGLPS